MSDCLLEKRLGADWPKPVSRKTSEDGVKKSFLFDPDQSVGGVYPDVHREAVERWFFERSGLSLDFF